MKFQPQSFFGGQVVNSLWILQREGVILSTEYFLCLLRIR